MKKLRLLSKYKYKSVFFQIVFILATFSLISFIIFFNFSFKLITETFQEKNNLMYVNVLNNAKNAVDYSLKGLHNIITHTCLEKSIIQAVVIPQSADSSNDMEVLTTLSTLREENELVSDVYLYIPKNEKIFTSRYEIMNRKQFNKSDVLDNYYASPSTGSSIEMGGRITRIFPYDEKFYLVRDFPLEGERRLGTLVIKLDTNKLYHVLQGQGVNYSNDLLVYDASNHPVFPGNINYSNPLNKYMETLPGKGEGMELVDNKRYFHTESSITQFGFLFVIDDSSLLPSFNQIFGIVFPLGVSVLIICLLLALFLTNKVYSPIKHLVSNVENASSASAPKSSRNEFDFLNGTFYNVINRYNDLGRVMKNILPDVSRKLFDDLLKGKPMETSYIESILESIDSPLKGKGNYNVMVLKMEQSTTAEEMDLFLITVVKILNEKTSDTFRYHIQMTENAVLSVLFEFEKNTPDLKLKLYQLEIEKSILSRSKNLHLNVLLEKGKLYPSIQEVQFSYEEALHNLTVKKNSTEEPENSVITAKSEELTQSYYNKEYFALRIKKISDLILNNDDAGALIMAKQISKAIAESDNSIEDIRLFFNIYIDAILDMLIGSNININTDIFFSKPQTTDELNVANDPFQIQQYVETFCEQAIALATEYCKKQQHKYIVAAKKYIESHYSDPNLSLSEVSHYVNTNTSYLSKLFKNNLNVNFNDYLNSYRIEKAKAFLDTTAMTVKEVSTVTGFNSQQNFIRVFKKFEGITPGQY